VCPNGVDGTRPHTFTTIVRVLRDCVTNAYLESQTETCNKIQRPFTPSRRSIESAGGTAIAVPADVTDLDAMNSAVARVAERFGRLDIVDANAGITPIGRPVLDYEPGEWRETLDIDLTGAWTTAKATVPGVAKAGARADAPGVRR
jgi:NAD(P)-dependent dehydrogenase (short-subunit alcohol dehydrogenase family)